MKALSFLLFSLGLLSLTYGQPSSSQLSQYAPPLTDAYVIAMPTLNLAGDGFTESPSTLPKPSGEVPEAKAAQDRRSALGLPKGITYMARKGSPVYAVADGRFASIRPQGLQEGWCLQLRHANGIRSEYITLDHVQVEEGQKIAKGDLLGYTSEDQFHFRLKQKKETLAAPAHFYQKDKIVVKAF